MRASATPRAIASLRRRLAAFGLDYLLVVAWVGLVTGLGIGLRTAAPAIARTLFASPASGELAGFVSLTLPVCAYFALSEAGPDGATWGKRRLGLRVTTLDGRRIGLGRSIVRTGLKFLPWELAHAVIWRYAFPGSAPEAVLDIGLVVVWGLVGANVASALLDSRRQTLYDRISGTVVTASSDQD